MSTTARRLRPVRTVRALLRLLVLSLTVTIAAGGGTALAGTDSFCNQSVAPNSICAGPSHSLTAARGWNNNTGNGCGGAVGYGNFYCANPAGCHTYGGTTVLTPGIRHQYSVSKSMSGYSTWGSTPPPSYCDPGAVYSAVTVAGPVQAGAADRTGVPVMDRPAATGPDALDPVAPGADLGQARHLDTPAGDAWVFLDASGQRLCLAVDDHGTGLGYSCQLVTQARDAGSIATLQDSGDAAASGDLVIALPGKGVDGVTVERADGTTRTVAADAGAVVLRLGAKDRAVTLAASPEAPKGTRAARRLVVAR